jgi:hypothetical protein
VFIKHPLENSMASLSFTSTMLDEGTTFIFDSWICIANGLGGFNNHLPESRKPEASTPTQSSDIDEFIDNLDELLPRSTQADRKDVRFQRNLNSCCTRTARIRFKPI